MKKNIFAFFIVLLMIISIVQVNESYSYFLNKNREELSDSSSSSSAYDVEREVAQIKEVPSTSYGTRFRLSPLTINSKIISDNLSPKISEEPLTVNIDLEKQVISFGETLKYIIQVVRGFKPASGEKLVLDIIEGQYWGWYFYWLEDPSNYENRIIESKVITTGPDGEYLGQFTPLSSGIFSIIIRTLTNTILETRSFTVANIGLFWRVSTEFVEGENHHSIAYILNTNDFSPVPNVVTKLSAITYEYNSQTGGYDINDLELFSGVSNSEGIVEINFFPSSFLASKYYFLANLSATYNGESVYVARSLNRGGYYWGPNGYSEYEPYEFIITTDKPIYIPGETIKARILLFENNYLKVTREPKQTTFTLKFLSPSHYTIVQRVVTTNEYGVATYAFPLDIDAELGKYLIVTQKEQTLVSQEIRVDKYEKPAFRVILGLDHEYVSPGGTVSGSVTAEYYFGKPVFQAGIQLSIGTFGSLTGVTDSKGFWEFKYTLPSKSSFENIYSVPINVTVTDPVGRKVTSSAIVQISNEVYTWAYVNPWFPKLGENITIYFGAYQYSGWGYIWYNYWQPLTDASVRIRMYALYGQIPVYIESLSSKTDNNGQGQIEYVVPKDLARYYSRFKGIVEVDSGDGRKGTSTFYFTVQRNSVNIVSDKATYQQGDTVNLDISVYNSVSEKKIEGNVRIRIFDSDYEMIGYSDLQIPDSGAKLSLKLSQYAPSGKYIIYVYLETLYDSDWGTWTYYRYSNTFDFYVGSKYSISLTSNKLNYSLSDSMTISGHLEGTTNAPIMIQFVKKGITATEYIYETDVTDFTIQIDNIEFLAPLFWVFAFVILDNGNVLESYLPLEIDSTIIVEINSDKQIYKPGENAKIHIDAFDANHNQLSSIMAVSFIDSSVFGIQPDLETENSHFSDQVYWPSVWTAVSWKSRQDNWWFWWYDDILLFGGSRGFGGRDDVYTFSDAPEFSQTYENKRGDSTDVNAKQRDKEVRDNLPENAYWNPLIIGESGHIEIDIVLPDTIGEWTVRVVTTTSSGKGVLSKYTFKTFLPFFIELEKDPYVLQDDVFVLKAIVYNYLDEVIDAKVEIETESGILVLGNPKQNLRLPSGFLGSIGWSCLAVEAGFFNITLYTDTKLKNGIYHSDALRKSLEILPNGIESEFKASGFIYSDPTFSYFNYLESVKQKVFLELSLGLGTIALSSWEKLIRYPYGCTEQTISQLIPNALVLEYLKITDQLSIEDEAKINDMILSGLSRIYSLRHTDGGWGWWHLDESRVYMTSLVLYGLGMINDTDIYIDQSIVKSALNLLIQMQNNDGSWNPDSWRNIDTASFTAFVLRPIIYWADLLDETVPIIKAINFISTSWNDVNQRSTYLAGLYLDGVSTSAFSSSSFEENLLNYLINEVKLSSDGYYWSYATEEHYWWRALGGNVEITALAIKALVNNNPSQSMHVIRGSIQWLLQQQSYYGWGNTADTAAAISTIISLTQSTVSSNEDTNVTIILNGQEFNTYSLSLLDQPSIYIELDDLMQTGENSFEFLKEGTGNVSYYFYSNQVLRSLPLVTIPETITSSPNQPIEIEISLLPTSSNVFPIDLIITPLRGEIVPTSTEPWVIPFLEEEEIVSFNYQTPSETGVYEILGFEISYRLSDLSQEKLSPGIINRIYGPIQLSVINPVGEVTFGIKIIPSITSSQIHKKSIQKTIESNDIMLERTYSKIRGFVKGDLVYVTLKIQNNKQVENFVMLEDNIPAGFSLDESTIDHPAESYTVTTTGVTFFFPELELGLTEIKYGLIVQNVRQSLVIPAKLTSMYEIWDITSSSAILGDTKIGIDLKTGTIAKDLQAPILNKFTVQEQIVDGINGLQVKVDTTDNWGIASVRFFIKQSFWQVFDCSNENTEWVSFITDLNEGNSEFYFEIIDTAGNVLISDSVLRYLELQDLNIPFLPIALLILFSLLSAIGLSSFVRKKRI